MPPDRAAAPRVVPVVLAVGAVGGLLLPLLTLRRFPTPFADVQLYASIALSRHLYGVGVPTVTWNSPTAVDHIPFYGPVFFDLCALALRLFGVRLLSFRLVSLFGALVFLTGTLALTRQFTASRDRMLLAAALVVFTPDVNFAMAAGSMHMLAVGLEVLAMAAFVQEFDRRRGGVIAGFLAGGCLALAALTTPRSYPFIFAFVCAALVPSIYGTAREAVRYRLAAALLVILTAMTGWAVASHGSVTAWARYLAFIFTHEDTDVALLPTAVRDFSFHWSGVLVPGAAVGLGLLAAWSIRHRRGGEPTGAAVGAEAARNGALSFLIACAWIDLITTSVVLNYTFSNGEYIALPLFAVVIAWPWNAFAIRRQQVAALIALLLALETGVVAYRSVCLAVRWEAHDPDPLTAFIAQHVPRGSVVAGPEAPYLFPVEQNGSRYRTVRARSWADWARWVPIVEPQALAVARARPQPDAPARYFIWRNDDDVPVEYSCALTLVVARFEPPPVDSSWPAWVIRASERYPGYPSSTLYRLPAGCPTGYDPTRSPVR